MKRWAMIEGSRVVSVVDQDTEPGIGGAWVEITDQHVGPGYGYDGAVFSDPVPVRHITQYAFRQRFTQAERVAVEIASLDDAAATTEARQQAAALRVAMGDLAQARFVDLDLPELTASLAALEAAGLLAAGRAQEIAGAPVQDAERP